MSYGNAILRGMKSLLAGLAAAGPALFAAIALDGAGLNLNGPGGWIAGGIFVLLYCIALAIYFRPLEILFASAFWTAALMGVSFFTALPDSLPNRIAHDMAWDFRAEGQHNPEALLMAYDAHRSRITDIAVSPDNSIIASAGTDGRVALHEFPSGRFIRALKCQEPADMVRFSPDNALLLARTRSGQAQIWNPATGTLKARIGLRPGVQFADFAADSQHVIATEGRLVALWEPGGMEARWTVETRGGIAAAALTPDRTGLLVAYADGQSSMEMYDVDTGALINRFRPPCVPLRVLALSPDTENVAAANGLLAHGAVLRRLASLGRADNLKGTGGFIRRLAFNPEGDLLAPSGERIHGIIWDLNNDQSAIPVPGHKGAVGAATFTPDNAFLVTGDASGTVRIWKLNALLNQ